MEEMWKLDFRDELNASSLPSQQVADEKLDRHLKAPFFVRETKKKNVCSLKTVHFTRKMA